MEFCVGWFNDLHRYYFWTVAERGSITGAAQKELFA